MTRIKDMTCIAGGLQHFDLFASGITTLLSSSSVKILLLVGGEEGGKEARVSSMNVEKEVYSRDDVYKVEETGVNWKALPRKSVTSKRESTAPDLEGEKDFNEDHREEIIDFVQSIPGFQECDEDAETWIACDAEDCGFQMLNDDEIVTYVREEFDSVDDEMEEDEDNNESSKVHQMLMRFLLPADNIVSPAHWIRWLSSILARPQNKQASSVARPIKWRYIPKTSDPVVRRKRATASALPRCLEIGPTVVRDSHGSPKFLALWGHSSVFVNVCGNKCSFVF
ncbi:uncharacterized protein TNCV_853061 [Trichonephila clavipes]|nr:uncharacterized protein TNCV_853061 [Trichonephila clavipes]